MALPGYRGIERTRSCEEIFGIYCDGQGKVVPLLNSYNSSSNKGRHLTRRLRVKSLGPAYREPGSLADERPQVECSDENCDIDACTHLFVRLLLDPYRLLPIQAR